MRSHKIMGKIKRRIMRNFLLVFTTTILLTGFSMAQVQILHCGAVMDVENRKILKEQSIVVNKDKIESIVGGYRNPEPGEQMVDLKAYTVLPGLMDMHVHIEHETNPNRYLERFTLNDADVAFQSARIARVTLMAGFTTVRDCGGTGVNTSLRDAIKGELVEGPRIFSAGKSLATTGGHADPTNGWRNTIQGDPGPKQGVLNGPLEARKAVRQRYKNGADFIKITATGGVLSLAKNSSNPQFVQDELEAIVETAKEYGMTTAAHAHGAEGMKRAVLAGITSIEHGTLMTEEVMDLMIEKGTYLVPTITAGKAVADSAKVEGYYPAIVVPKALEIGPQIQNTFAKAYKRGVKIAFGTDAGVFKHGVNALEFVYMTEVGMPPWEAIRSATVNAAEMMGVSDELGYIKPGFYADIIAVKGDPIKDISVLQHVHFVMKNGVVYKFEE